MTPRAVVLVALALLLVLLFPMILERIVNRMIFVPVSGVDLLPEELGLPGDAVFFSSEDGTRLHGFHLPPIGEYDGVPRAFLFFHGNAGNASHRLPNAAELARLGAEVLVLDYRGYGRSEGSPTEEGLYLDARAALEHLVHVRGIPEERVVVFGRSLGGAVAVDLAQDRKLAGVILESTFTNVPDIAETLIGVVGRTLAPPSFDSESKISRLRSPLLGIHGDRDRIIPLRLGRRLFDAAPEPKSFETIPGAGHNDLVRKGGRPYFERIARFLEEVAPAEG